VTTRTFAVACDAAYFPGLRALANSIATYHGRAIPLFVYQRDLGVEQIDELHNHPADIRVWNVADLPHYSYGMWEAKQQIFAHSIGRARQVYLLDADLVLVSPVDDVFELAACGLIVGASHEQEQELVYDATYAVYDPRLPGTRQAYMYSGAVCLDVVHHWDLAGLWAFAANWAKYSPGAGAPLGLPGYGDQCVFNAIAGMLGKVSRYHMLADGPWGDCRQRCILRIRSSSACGALEVWNETTNERQRVIHSCGPKWWTAEGARHLRRFGDKLACFEHFALNPR
jgi:hypothetical protein